MISFKNSYFFINSGIVYAERSSFSETSQFRRLDELGYNSVETIVESRPQSTFSFDGYLTKGGFSNLCKTGLNSFSGGMNGLGFNSGFLSEYSISAEPLSPIKQSLKGSSFDRLNRQIQFNDNLTIYNSTGFYRNGTVFSVNLDTDIPMESGKNYRLEVDAIQGGFTFLSMPDFKIGGTDISNPSTYFKKKDSFQYLNFTAISGITDFDILFSVFPSSSLIFSGIRVIQYPFNEKEISHGAFSLVKTGESQLVYNENLISFNLSITQTISPFYGIGGTNIIGYNYQGGQISCALNGTGLQNTVDFECSSGTNLVLNLRNLCNSDLEDIRISGLRIVNSSLDINEQDDVVGSLELIRYF